MMQLLPQCFPLGKTQMMSLRSFEPLSARGRDRVEQAMPRSQEDTEGYQQGYTNCMTYMWEEDNMGLQKRNGNVPGIVGFA